MQLSALKIFLFQKEKWKEFYWHDKYRFGIVCFLVACVPSKFQTAPRGLIAQRAIVISSINISTLCWKINRKEKKKTKCCMESKQSKLTYNNVFFSFFIVIIVIILCCVQQLNGFDRTDCLTRSEWINSRTGG